MTREHSLVVIFKELHEHISCQGLQFSHGQLMLFFRPMRLQQQEKTACKASACASSNVMTRVATFSHKGVSHTKTSVLARTT